MAGERFEIKWDQQFFLNAMLNRYHEVVPEKINSIFIVVDKK